MFLFRNLFEDNKAEIQETYEKLPPLLVKKSPETGRRVNSTGSYNSSGNKREQAVKLLDENGKPLGQAVENGDVKLLNEKGKPLGQTTTQNYSTRPLLVNEEGKPLYQRPVVATLKPKKSGGVFAWLKNSKPQKVQASTSPSSIPVSPSSSRKPMNLFQKLGIFLSGLGFGLSTHFMPAVKNLVPAFTHSGENVEQVLNHSLSGRIADAEKAVKAGALKDFVQVQTPHGTAVVGLKGHTASQVRLSQNTITLPNGKVVKITPQVVTPEVQVSVDGNNTNTYPIPIR